MLLAGDEMARSQGGNNNAWCQDNATSWLDWNRLAANRDLFDFFRDLIAFRKRYSLLRPRYFEAEESGERRLTWHGRRLHHADWSADSHALGMHLQGKSEEAEIYLIVNAALDDADFALPLAAAQRPWRRFVDTALAAGRASCSPGEEAPLPGQTSYRVRGRSVVVLVR
jgi:glycogen operon protein